MKLKVCGMKNIHNIAQIASINPNYMGFIFWEKSTRFINKNTPYLRFDIIKTGVFVNSSFDYILEKIKIHQLKAVQLHGGESEDLCKKLKELKTVEVIKVFNIKNNFDFQQISSFEKVCDYYLFDTKGKLPGGNGYRFNWDILRHYPSKKKFFLSGGIGLSDVSSIIEILKLNLPIYAIDVNSKFELPGGNKDIQKLIKFKKQLGI